MQKIDPLCAFDVNHTGQATPCSGVVSLQGAKGGGYRWVHFDLNQTDLSDWLAAQLPPLAAAALVQTETRPRCDLMDGGIIANLRGVNLNPGSNPEDMVSLRLWVADGLIVSARLRKIWAVDAIRQHLSQGTGPESVSAFLVDLTQRLTNRIEQVSHELEEETDKIEEHMIERFEGLSPMVAPIRQSVIKLRRFVGPQRDALARLAGTDLKLIDEGARALIKETAHRATRTVEELDATRERLAAIQDHLDVQHSIAIGRNGYILSVVAAIFLPLGFLTGLFGVNVGGMPGINSPVAFAVLTGASVLVGLVLFAVFRWSKWL